jgi:hypothetical protein
MGYASRLGRAKISAKFPQAAGQCDRCGFIFTHADLRFQFDYAGTGLINKQMLVCRSCEDTPQNQLRAIVIPSDPKPIMNPRVPDFVAQRTDKRITIGKTITDPITGISARTGDQRTTQNNDDRIVQKDGDYMLRPRFSTRTRITEIKDRRTTQVPDVRITQLLPDFGPAPAPQPIPPEPTTDGVRLTMDGRGRITQDGRIRDVDITPTPAIDAVLLTLDGRGRITQDGRIRECRIGEVPPVTDAVLETVDGKTRITQDGRLRECTLGSSPVIDATVQTIDGKTRLTQDDRVRDLFYKP